MRLERFNNTIEEWKKAKKTVEEHIKNKTPGNIELEVEVSVDDSKNESDVLLLQHYFPIVDVARDSKIKTSLNVIVNETAAEHTTESKWYQVSQYLYVQNLTREGINITINGNAVDTQTRYGRLIPLMSVNNNLEGKFYYKDIVKTFSDSETMKLLVDFSKIVITAENSQIIKTSKEHRNLIDKCDYIYNDLKSMSQKNVLDDKKYIEKLFFISKDDNVYNIYIKLFLSNLIYIMTTIKGTRDDQIKINNKVILVDQLIDFYNKKCDNLPILTLYIWSLLVRCSFEERIIFNEDKDTKEKFLFNSILEKFLIDASSYTDGMYQLIENSCLYSESKCASYSLRLYNTDIKAKGDALVHNVNTIKRLSDTYKNITEYNDSKMYIEITILDNAYNKEANESRGMVWHYNAENPDVSRKVETLKELFNRKPQSQEDVLLHYGLRTFERIVLLNKGCLIANTANVDGEYVAINKKGDYSRDDCYKYVKSSKKDEKERIKNDYNITSYKILIPVYTNFEPAKVYRKTKEKITFETDSILNPPKQVYIYLGNISTNEKSKPKNEILERAYSELKNEVREDNQIVCLSTKNYHYHHIELFAKVIMRYTFENKDKTNRIAIFFDSKNYINEFVRIYSVFFDKTGENFDEFKVINTQIALCSMGTSGPEVNFILSGSNLISAKQNASSYSYYNSDASLEFLHLVEHLTRCETNENKDSVIKPIFPFDLYLKNTNFEIVNGSCVEDESWFHKHINHVLNTELQKNSYGCKIENVNVAIGSKIHIDTFYNAELLFHNYGNVCRFAYMIAQQILYEDVKKEKLLLIGYEEYSSLLINEVKNILETYKSIKVDTLIFSSETDELDIEKQGGLWPKFKKFIKNNDIDNYVSYIVLPVATTLTTIYKIRNIMKRILNTEPEFGINTALIVVGGTHKIDSDENTQGVRFGYWKSVDTIAKQIVINDNSLKRDIDKLTKYYFSPNSKWEMSVEIEKDDKNRCLIGVDKTNTLPSVIFESLESNKKVFVCDSENNERINKLLGKVSYSHISDFDNHFQFNIDFDDYCNDDKTSKDIENWILDKVYKNIDTNAFNIIVTPLSKENSTFLKQVVNCAFENNVRLFNVNINTAYREEIRSKFNYITEEYFKMKKLMRNPVINVYYVDTCLVSGITLQRGRQLINMLLKSEDLNSENINIYKGIILLTNRSSYETINNLLTDSAMDNCYYYIRLNVPSYNTRNGVCPSCGLSSQYKLMRKRASTHEIADEYARLHMKFLCRDKLSYDIWLDNMISSSTSYKHRFLQWLHYHSIDLNKTKNSYKNILGEEILLETDGSLLSAFQKIKDSISSADDNLCVFDNDEKKAYTDFIKNHIISERDFLRTVCTHRVFTNLELVMSNAVSEEDAEIKTRKIVLDLLKNTFKDIDKNKYSKEEKIWYKGEWLISYIKILSRKQVARYYHIRNTIYTILLEVAEGVISNKYEVEDDIKFLVDLCCISKGDRIMTDFTPEIKLSIFLTVIRRLSALHSLFVINNIANIERYYNDCREQYDGMGYYAEFYKSYSKMSVYKDSIKFMSKRSFDFNVAKLAKWSAMADYDDSKCFTLERRIIEQNKDIAEKTEEDIKNLAYLENTQVIFSGIQRLTEYYLNKDNDISNIYNCIDDLLGSIKQSGDYSIINTHSLFFKFMELFSENNKGKVKSVTDIYEKMCLYFYTLKNICERNTALDSPYAYEDLCNYIRDIVRYDECVIVCDDNNQRIPIASSSLDLRYYECELKKKIVDKLLDNFNDNVNSDMSIINSIAQKFRITFGENNKDNQKPDEHKFVQSLLIKIPLTEKDKPKLNIYFVFYSYSPELLENNSIYVNPNKFDDEKIKEEKLKINDLWDIRNVLFLRDRLSFAFGRDVIFLENLVKSRKFIKPLNNSLSKVMHISDLHISSSNYKNIINSIEKTDFNFIPDLLLITGDVAQGSYSAMSFLENYRNASKVIKALAKKLWGYSVVDSRGIRSFIRNDWKKRILISTGNHDYASMNDLIAENKKRKTLSGKPVSEPSDTLIRHSYFIIFLHDLLGMDIDEMVENDINELINYDMLNISVFNINSNSRVNPYRTNKVRINTGVVKRLFKSIKEENFLLCMMHHTPMYNINYINDVYYLKNNIKSEEVKNKLEKFGLKDEKLDTIWLGLINSVQNEFESEVYNLSKDSQESLLKSMLVWLEANNNKFFNENGLDDFLYYVKTDPKERRSDDRCNHLISTLKEQKMASESDINAYVCFAKVFFEGIKQKYYVLGGHNHRPFRCRDALDGPFKNCLGIYEASKFCDENNVLSFILFELDRNTKKTLIKNYPKDEYDKLPNSIIIKKVLE